MNRYLIRGVILTLAVIGLGYHFRGPSTGKAIQIVHTVDVNGYGAIYVKAEGYCQLRLLAGVKGPTQGAQWVLECGQLHQLAPAADTSELERIVSR